MAKSFDALVMRTTNKHTRDGAARRTQQLLDGMLQSDMQISALRGIIAALGGELGIVARFPSRSVQIEPFAATKRNRKRAV